MSLKPAVQVPLTDREYQKWCLESGDTRVMYGFGSPEGVVTSIPGRIYLNGTGGANTTLYVKESGTGNVGWVGK